ncbi:MAG: hypothetical protein ACYSYV_01150 [Planctomycetota bacterium]|jgi:hypothetical protein
MTTERTVSVGRLKVKAYAAEKPVALGARGRFVTLAEAVKQPSALSSAASLASLEDDDQAKLVIERNRLEPDFTLGVIGQENIRKRDLLDHIKQRTPLGNMAIQAELNYVADLVSQVARPARPVWPRVPPVKPVPIPPKWRRVPKQWWRFLRTCVLFCENTTDGVTKYAATYRKKYVHPVFKKRGFCVIVLEGVHDVAAEFIPRAKSRRVVYISGIGHGNPTTYTGHLNSPLLKACQYDPAVVKGKSIHFLSCQTAKQLGPDTVKKGAKSYAGYYENFTFVHDNPSTPINERALFWKADSTYDISMALGKSAKEAGLRTIAAFNSAIATVPGTAAATWLTWDRNWFRYANTAIGRYGRGGAKIFPLMITPFLEVEEALQALEV